MEADRLSKRMAIELDNPANESEEFRRLAPGKR